MNKLQNMTTKNASSAFSTFRVDEDKKSHYQSVYSPPFGCTQPFHTNSPFGLYPSFVSAGHIQRYYGQEIMPVLNAKGVIPHVGPCHLPAAMFGYRTVGEEEKPSQSYVGLIGKAILSTLHKKLVLSDIYNYILTHYQYFRNKGSGWRNSIRHNLSLNECFIKVGRSPNGKGHYWAINPANYEDFSKGEYRRRRVSKKQSTNASADKTTIDNRSERKRKIDLKCLGKCDEPQVGIVIKAGRDVYGPQPYSSTTSKTSTTTENKGFHIENLLSGLLTPPKGINSTR